jgi:porphobilinogen deaminase
VWKPKSSSSKRLGDKLSQSSLSQIGGKGIFNKELEDALFEEEVDDLRVARTELPLDFCRETLEGSLLRRNRDTSVLWFQCGIPFSTI